MNPLYAPTPWELVSPWLEFGTTPNLKTAYKAGKTIYDFYKGRSKSGRRSNKRMQYGPYEPGDSEDAFGNPLPQQLRKKRRVTITARNTNRNINHGNNVKVNVSVQQANAYSRRYHRRYPYSKCGNPVCHCCNPRQKMKGRYRRGRGRRMSAKRVKFIVKKTMEKKAMSAKGDIHDCVDSYAPTPTANNATASGVVGNNTVYFMNKGEYAAETTELTSNARIGNRHGRVMAFKSFQGIVHMTQSGTANNEFNGIRLLYIRWNGTSAPNLDDILETATRNNATTIANLNLYMAPLRSKLSKGGAINNTFDVLLDRKMTTSSGTRKYADIKFYLRVKGKKFEYSGDGATDRAKGHIYYWVIGEDTSNNANVSLIHKIKAIDSE